MKALYNDENLVLITFPNKTTQKEIKRFILDYFEPLFYQECSHMSYDYRKERNVKHTINVWTDNGIDYYVQGKAWDPTIESALKKNPINTGFWGGYIGTKDSDAVIMNDHFIVRELPQHKKEK